MADDAYAFTFEDVEYRMPTFLLSEARAIQKVTGLTMVAFDEALKAGDANALIALIWVAKKRHDPALRFEDVDGDVMSFAPLVPDDVSSLTGEAEEPGKVDQPDGPSTGAGTSAEAE